MSLDTSINVILKTSNEEAKKGNRTPRIKGKNGDQIQNRNFKSIAKLGLAIRTVRMGNELVGSYTNNRLRQKAAQRNMLMFQYGVGIAKFGKFGLAYAGADLGYRAAMHQIDIDKRNREAQVLRNITGITARERSRQRGEGL